LFGSNSDRLNSYIDKPILGKNLDLDQINPLVRIIGRDQPASQILTNVWANDQWPIYRRLPRGYSAPQHDGQNSVLEFAKIVQENNVDGEIDNFMEDYTLIDPTLQLDPLLNSSSPQSNFGETKNGLGYAGLTPSQRRQFIRWLTDLDQPAPLAYQHLYIAHLEVRLLEGGEMAAQAHKSLIRLQGVPAWRRQEMVARALMLSYWLRQDGTGMAAWVASGKVPKNFLGIVLGWRGLIDSPAETSPAETSPAEISPADLTVITAGWQLSQIRLDEKMVKLHLDSLQDTLKAEPLRHALTLLPDEAMHPLPWRCAHRDLRIALPQPDLRPQLEPLLRDLLDAAADATEYSPEKVLEASLGEIDKESMSQLDSQTVDDLGWHLILEFSESRSEYFEKALRSAKKMASFTQLMDENRNIIYRVIYTKKHLSKFRSIWFDIRKWSGVKIYLNGEKIKAGDVHNHIFTFS